MPAVLKLSSPATREFWEIPVLCEDEHILALDKPAGLLISPDRFNPERPSLMNLVHAGIAAGKPWAVERRLAYLTNAHPLDVEASGVLLLAKSKSVLVALANLFSSEKVGKKYVALVRGAPNEDRFEINAKLAIHPANPGVTRVDQKLGKMARTVVEVLESFSGYTLVRCEPMTERMHQIRVHLRQVGLPVVGDAVYGGKPLLLSRLKKDFHLKEGKTERPLISRPALHAAELTLAHPMTNELLVITAPRPKDLTVAVKYLRRFAN